MARSICEVIFALVMVFVGVFPFGSEVQKYALIVLGLGLLVHAFVCNRCKCKCDIDEEKLKVKVKTKVKKK